MIFLFIENASFKNKKSQSSKKLLFFTLRGIYIYNINGFQSPMFFISVITYHLGFAQKKKKKYIYIYI